ncbi:P-loop containing nucleoside triphosphate hydrolase protein [Pholiota conissans]|uniref:P-loop containing nucleoside triphosphate hydrolase protein n=1 Tax=Pholiota conissans TaxID=109636 RepID=A0A9P5Z596_9AGAR|nr:P-loop containing nucleoside triphosphate hydrolase protein [Pholiota conissans]
MNPHYPYPPPGLAYYPLPPPVTVPAAPHGQFGGQIPSPTGVSLSGQQPHPPPHLHTYAASQNTMHYPQRNSYHVDTNGWYTPTVPPPPPPNVALAQKPPMYPPGLALPTRAAPAISTEASTAGFLDASNMHEYWAGRLAPLPGYQSRPILLPMRGKTPPPVEPEPVKKQVSPLKLLPPHSFFGSTFERDIISPTTPSEKTFVDEKKFNENTVDPLRKSSFSSISSKTTKNDENNAKKEFQLDKYADSFIPRYLYNIQKETHPLKPLPPIPVFPSVSYLQSFLIPKLINQTAKNDVPSLLREPPIAKDAQPAPLNSQKYLEHWTDILRWELDAVTHDKEQIVLWKLVPKVAVWKDAEFVFVVPGIRENHPHLEVGDLVHMREVHPTERRGTRRALEGRVVALGKREGLVRIQSVPLKDHVQTYVPLSLSNIKTENGFVVFSTEEVVPFSFNVSFMTNSGPLCTMQTAVASVARLLTLPDQNKHANLARQWIFPDVPDFTDSQCVVLKNGKIQEDQWIDSGLNAEQRLAVTSIALYQSPVPRLISGPPGTGKTRTVVEAVLQIFRVQPEACILVCAPSNPATDTLALRLQQNLLQHEMLRLNAPNRTFAEVPDSIKPYCYVEDNKFALPPWKQLMKYRVIVTSCLDAAILLRAQCTNITLMAMEEEVTVSLHPHRPRKHIVQPHWTHLLIDEAAQGSEPELAVPISVVLPEVCSEVGEETFVPQLALCGDINQLGPNVVSNEARAAGFEISLLERLFERPLYHNFMNNVSSQLDEDADNSLPYISLVKNYRSHAAILMPPSAIFYNDTLQPSAITNGKIVWAGLAKPHLPLKFIGTDAVEESNDERASWFNPGQINKVVEVIKSLLNEPRLCEPPLRPREIAVMAPWRQQVWALRKRLRDEKCSAVDVGTVEDYQGRESRVVIISCVRSSSRFLEEDYKKGMGFMLQRKRMNVAITRAKELLIVVGNGALLQGDPYWKSFLQFTIRNGLYEGPELDLEMDGSYISRLESLLIHSGNHTLDPEQEGLLIAGGVAREVLRE